MAAEALLGEAPGRGLFARFVPKEAAGRRNARFGYLFAGLATLTSGVSVYVSSLGVRDFSDPVLYTALKDAVVGVVLLVPLGLSAGWREDYRRLDQRSWAWLVAIALTGGSIPFALYFSGLKLTTAATGALLNHLQYVPVAVFAAGFLRERIRPAMWAGFGVLLLGLLLGAGLHAFRWDEGAWLIGASSVLFAVDFVIAKHLLRSLATLTVMTARMTMGTAMLLAYLALLGRLGAVSHLDTTQWGYVLATGATLLLFTVATFTAIRHASVSAVLAIGTAAPIITTLIQVAADQRLSLGSLGIASLAVTLAAAAAITVLGLRQEARAEQLEAGAA
jgi:drug/metabolite transporter (DMT)-like permease